MHTCHLLNSQQTKAGLFHLLQSVKSNHERNVYCLLTGMCHINIITDVQHFKTEDHTICVYTKRFQRGVSADVSGSQTAQLALIRCCGFLIRAFAILKS